MLPALIADKESDAGVSKEAKIKLTSLGSAMVADVVMAKSDFVNVSTE